LLHISELADHKIDKPQDIVKQDDEVEVKILRVDNEARKIGLSLRRVQWAAEEQAADSGQRTKPIGVQTVFSDADMGEIVGSKDKANPRRLVFRRPNRVRKRPKQLKLKPTIPTPVIPESHRHRQSLNKPRPKRLKPKPTIPKPVIPESHRHRQSLNKPRAKRLKPKPAMLQRRRFQRNLSRTKPSNLKKRKVQIPRAKPIEIIA
jgi:hypothetical protein